MTELSPIKRALLEQRRLKARIEELERARSAPIAVIGVGCRFPGGASGPQALWRVLCDGVDAISDIPPGRWDLSRCYDPDPEAPGKIATRFGGFLEGIDQFDPQVFGITPREAETMDPQQRLLLEVSWEALEHAGCPPDRRAGSSTGVFVGISTNDYFQQYAHRGALADIDAYLATGSAHSVASGRISYLLGLQGPAVSLDTACSSSLVSVHLACESIRAGGCDMALAGGVGILLSLENFVSLSKARMMAADGRCKTFDARADGFVRSEGCGIVVLKRLVDAQADGDRILAVIRGTACNQDGRSNGMTAPNGPAQQAVIRAALADAGVAPSAMSYLEAHGTGTVLGDPIEVESLTAVLGEGRGAAQPLRLGSVKTNLGHLEAAAGVAGLIKTVLALHHRAIPASLHFRTPNPHIRWDAYPYLHVPTTLTPWETDGGPRIAGVSAFGFSGTNAHLVLEEAPEAVPQSASGERPLHVLALSGKAADALGAATADLLGHFQGSDQPLADACYSVNTGRAGLSHRAIVLASTPAEMRSRLERLAEGRTDARVLSGVVADGAAPRVLFFFPGEGSQYPGMGRQLYETQPSFRHSVEQCDALLRAERQPGVLERLNPAGVHASPQDQAAYSQPAFFALEYALAALWQSWGATPAAVLGHGVGEYVAAVVAGVLRLEDALRLVTARDGLGRQPPANAAPSLDPATLAPPQVPFFSSVTGRRVAPAEVASVAHWASPVLPLQGDAALAAAVDEGFAVILEVGPSTGQGQDQRRPGAGAAACWLPSLSRGHSDWETMCGALGLLYVRGVPIDWRGFDRDYPRSRVDVPASPWMRERYWFEEAPSSAASGDDAQATWRAVNAAAGRQAALVPMDVELSRYAALWGELDGFTTQAVARAVGALGLFRRPGESHTVESAMAGGKVLPVYRHLVSLWLQRLTRAGLLERSGDAFVCRSPLDAGAPSGTGSPGPASDAVPVLRDYLQRCDRQMAAIVAGRQGPLETLFPDGAFETADFFYRDWGLARYYNGILESAAESLLRSAAGRPLRILEIGAGTGGTTSILLPVVAAGTAEYWFTDVSEHFFARAEQAFAGFPFVRFQRFDLDADPQAQGIPPGRFDLVVAANAVHATKDLGGAIERTRSLLAPGGLLLLYEVTTHFDWFEMSIALIEGWQHHDDRLRGEIPLLPAARWESALRERGFDRVACFPPQGSAANVLGHHVIVASTPGVAVPVPVEVAPMPAAPRSAPVAGGAEATGPSLRDRLAALTYGERRDTLQQLVQRQVARVMRLRAGAPPPGVNDRLMNIGVDSLMAVEVKKLLLKEIEHAVDLPSTLVYDHPTIAAIAAFILKSLGLDSDAAQPAAGAGAQPSGPSAADAIADLSDEEVGALLAERLKGLPG